MYNFIYVFSKEARDDLVKKGFLMLKEDEKNNIYVFQNDDKRFFDISDYQKMMSNTLTF